MMHSLRHAGMRLIVGASALAVVGVHAQQSQPSAEKEFRIVRTDTPPVIDGRLDVVPSVSVSYNEDHQVSVTDTEFDPSADLFYKITPSLNASLTAICREDEPGAT